MGDGLSEYHVVQLASTGIDIADALCCHSVAEGTCVVTNSILFCNISEFTLAAIRLVHHSDLLATPAFLF